jgi:hypothetical protein
VTASETIARLRELQSKRTPGPWELAGDEQTEWAAFVTGPSGKPVGEIYPDNAANAAAIVAAMNSLEPLLACAEALSPMLRGLKEADYYCPDDVAEDHTVLISVTIAELREARAALHALAEGGGG